MLIRIGVQVGRVSTASLLSTEEVRELLSTFQAIPRFAVWRWIRIIS